MAENWDYIEESEKELNHLSAQMAKLAKLLDSETMESVMTHFVMMKMALVSLRGHAGEMAKDETIGETPVKIAAAMQEFAQFMGQKGNPDELKKMYDKSYAAVTGLLIATGKQKNLEE